MLRRTAGTTFRRGPPQRTDRVGSELPRSRGSGFFGEPMISRSKRNEGEGRYPLSEMLCAVVRRQRNRSEASLTVFSAGGRGEREGGGFGWAYSEGACDDKNGGSEVGFEASRGPPCGFPGGLAGGPQLPRAVVLARRHGAGAKRPTKGRTQHQTDRGFSRQCPFGPAVEHEESGHAREATNTSFTARQTNRMPRERHPGDARWPRVRSFHSRQRAVTGAASSPFEGRRGYHEVESPSNALKNGNLDEEGMHGTKAPIFGRVARTASFRTSRSSPWRAFRRLGGGKWRRGAPRPSKSGRGGALRHPFPRRR